MVSFNHKIKIYDKKICFAEEKNKYVFSII